MIAIFGLSAALIGCSASNSQVFNSSALDAFNLSPASDQTNNANNASTGQTAELDNDFECPSIAIRNGAGILTISKTARNIEPSPLDLRYQGSIIRTARECHVNTGVMTMKVGIEGRIITGPAGSPGKVDVPLRIAVVQEGVEPKTITSKFGQTAVTIARENDRAIFTHIDSDISFPMPQTTSDIDKYVIYVGFDPLGAQKQKKPAVKRKPSPKLAPQATPQPVWGF